MREVKLLIELQGAVKLLRLFVHLVVVLADEELDEVAEGLVDELLLSLRLLEVLDLLVDHLLDLLHVLDKELVLIRLRETFLSFLEEGLTHLEILLLVSFRNVVLNLRKVLPDRLQTKDCLLVFAKR